MITHGDPVEAATTTVSSFRPYLRNKSGRSREAVYAEYRLGQIREEKEVKKEANKRANRQSLWTSLMLFVAIVLVGIALVKLFE